MNTQTTINQPKVKTQLKSIIKQAITTNYTTIATNNKPPIQAKQHSKSNKSKQSKHQTKPIKPKQLTQTK